MAEDDGVNMIEHFDTALDVQASNQSEHDKTFAFEESEHDEAEDSETTTSRPISVRIPTTTLISPRSCYETFEPPCPVMRERDALRMLLPERCREDDFLELHLTDFAVYCDVKNSTEDVKQSPEEMRTLSAPNSTPLFFDGVLSNGAERVYLRRISIHSLPIGNYGQKSKDQTKDNIWIRSEHNATTDVYYKLGTPAAEYRRFYEPFLWVADLAKHVVDFFEEMHINGQNVSINHFRSDFASWLVFSYANSDSIEDLRVWMSKIPHCDYRSAVNANISFLHKESIGVLGEKKTYFHDLWNEVFFLKQYSPYRAPTTSHKTVVTNYIYNCFSHLPSGNHLEAMKLSCTTRRLRSGLISNRPSSGLSTFPPRDKRPQINDIGPGDTISTARDTVGSGTAWAKENARDDQHVDLWFALVQDVSMDAKGRRVFDVIWYYRPVDTLCGLMKYPWANELFLSDHCSHGESFKIREDEVLGVHEVEFGGAPETLKEFFCRQAYLTEDKIWVSLTESHLTCCHALDTASSAAIEYSPGDTVLVHSVRNSNVCQPCEVVGAEKDFAITRFIFRRLYRRHKIDPSRRDAPPNELVYSEDMVKLGPSRIVGRCHVRWFSTSEPVPTPYDRDGVGAFFFFTHQKQHTEDGCTILPLEEAPSSLKQGFDPLSKSMPKLRGLDLFCGGGNFGRGLEEGGSVTMKWANDIDSTALHTYMANITEKNQVSPFLGSIDDFQRLAIQGHFGSNVPRVGDVDFISGGSPCPGFSFMTNNRTTSPQRKNQSLVAAFASCVDLYRPKYGILENVVGIIQKRSNRDQDVFSQLMCALVGMGYQARLFFLDAITCGSAQVRSRVFIVFAAPGWALPDAPLQTHSYQPNVKNFTLGRLPTGEPMAEREIAACTPFEHKSASQATAGLPAIYDAKPDICIPFPDHRVVSSTNTKTMRNRVRLIPKFPYGMDFSQAWYGRRGTHPRAAGRGVLTRSERELFPATREGASMSSTAMGSNAYSRLQPDLPMPTIVTNSTPGDAKQGRTIHWSENRCLTVMEARRAQGFPDEEIILGSKKKQYKIVGNSVAREVSLALGTVVADAMLRSYGQNFRDLAMESVEDEEGDMRMDTASPVWESTTTTATGTGSFQGPGTPGTSVPTSPTDTTPPSGGTKRKRQP
ncbi:hypothetical protein PWT90_07644 [Aphanocladium album]|nr:hypothetical protein PWT90_07644 [Aphanocladium album]